MRRTEIAVVGAGPAGLSAAVSAARAGARVTLIDRYTQPGGQYFRQFPLGFRAASGPGWGDDEAQGRKLLAGLQMKNLEVLCDTAVFDAKADGTLELATADHSFALQAEKLILATGASERVIPFPGWTLPGVFTAGGLQNLVKTQRILPGRRIAVAGSGPLLYAVAALLIDAGAEVVALVEAGQPAEAAKHWPSLFANRTLAFAGARYLSKLWRTGVPVLSRHAILQAEGKGQLERVAVGKLDAEWHPQARPPTYFEVDALGLNFGFLPSIELARLLGCQIVFRPPLGGYTVAHNARMETSRPGIFVAGEAAGIGGASIAMLQGEMAGLAAAQQLEYLSEAQAEQHLRVLGRRLARQERFRDAMNAVFGLRPGIYDLIRDDTIVCRCEEATRAAIIRAAMESTPSLREVKCRTWAGMGSCQGRFCAETIQHLTAEALGVSVADLSFPRVRPPLGTVPVAALLEERP